MHPFTETEIAALARLLLKHEVLLVHKQTKTVALAPQSLNPTPALPLCRGDENAYIRLETNADLYGLLFETFFIDYDIRGEEMARLDAALRTFSDTGDFDPWMDTLRDTGRLAEWDAHELRIFEYYTRTALRPYDTSYIQLQ